MTSQITLSESPKLELFFSISIQKNNKIIPQSSTMADRTQRYQDGDRPRDSRSRSPRRHHSHSHRTRSPHRHHHKRKRSPEASPTKELPYNTRPLTKRDYGAFKPMFALYLDIQKSKILEELDEKEIQGRWKSFIGKW